MNCRVAFIAILWACSVSAAWAGRPLATDDAGTAELGQCYVEAWSERAGPQRALVVSPGCGVAPGVELGGAYSHLHPRDTVRAAGELFLKWVPEAAALATPAGELQFGLRLAMPLERPAGASWRRSGTVVLGLASLQVNDDWTLHANLGRERERASGVTGTMLNLAVAWTPMPPLLVFAETSTNNRRATFGGTTHSAGARWWLVPEKLGLDLTATRSIDAGTPTLWTVGIGWYGLGQ